jgi:predicted secreted hydrolase
MRAEGRVSVGGQTARVTGAAWFDHEWSTRALPEGAVGWDWFSLQLDDGRELMFFQIRRADGGIEPASAGTLVEADGTAVPVSLEDVRLTAEGLWRSPETGAEYPVEWRLELPAAGLDLRLEPWLPDQEMRVSVVYWEGAVRIHGTSRGAPVSGNGYLELTGYAESIEGSF